MNIGLLQLMSKYITLITISVMSMFNIGSYSENNKINNNININKNGYIVQEITKYSTVVEYNSKLPSNITNIKQEGEVGLSYKEEKKEEKVVVQQVTNQVIEKGTGAYGVYKGRLVGYGPDCTGCSGEGYLSYKTKEGKRHSLKYDGIYYEDYQYGKVRILAARKSQFSAGTIVKISKPDGSSFLGVVLDTMGEKTSKNVIMDLAYSSQSDKTVFGADGLTGNNMTFEVQRWGW